MPHTGEQLRWHWCLEALPLLPPLPQLLPPAHDMPVLTNCNTFLMQAASQQRRSVAASAAADEEGGAATGPGVPPAWDKAMRISADASTMLGAGEALTAELILKKGEYLQH